MANLIRRSGRTLRLYLTGFAMGMADLVPGVSGGTVAFLSGIYEELLLSIKTVSGESVRLLLGRKVRAAVSSVPFAFLVPLALGILTAVLTLAQALSYLLAEYPVLVWSFFFGLVLASIWVVLQRIGRWTVALGGGFVAMTVAAYVVVGAIPVETPYTLPAIFLSGMIAICAMILPGISGSFILLLLGKYQQILAAVTERDVLVLGVFGMGCVLGLALFSRVLTWLFKAHHDLVVALLAGLMLGSLRKVWPWKETVLFRVNSHGVEVPLVERNILPAAVDGVALLSLLLAAAGVVLVIYLSRLNVTKEQMSEA